MIGCASQACFNIYFITENTDNPAFGTDTSDMIIRTLFCISNNIYFMVFWQFCVHYYQQVDTLGNDRLWDPIEDVKDELE